MFKGMVPNLRRMLALWTVITLVTVGALIVNVPAVQAVTACQDGGYLLVYARGTNSGLGTEGANQFRDIRGSFGSDWPFLEVGSLDGNSSVDPGHYDANAIDWHHSIERGVAELLTFLSARSHCSRETLVFGGYSMGAEVIGRTINRLNGIEGANIKSRIGYVALYGDPLYLGRYGSPGCEIPWWVKLVTNCQSNTVTGMLGTRSPYGPEVLRDGRFGSWCDTGDGFCNGRWWNEGNHGTIYSTQWIPQSAPTIAARAIAKRNQLNPTLPPAPGGSTPPPGGYPPQPPPPPPPPSNDTIVASSDFNQNGMADVAFAALRGDGFTDVRMLLSNGQQFTDAGNWRWLDVYGWHGITPLVGDVSGDNKPDYVFVSNEHQYGIKVFVCIGTGSGLQAPALWWSGPGYTWENTKVNIGDMDNNSTDDIVLTALRGDGFADVRVLLSNWSGFVDTGIWRALDGFGWHGLKPMVGDVNGDKFADYVMLTNEHAAGVKAFVLASYGFGLHAPTLWWDAPGYTWDHIKPTLGDLDRNGKADILFAAKRADQFADARVLLSTGQAFADHGNWRNLGGFGWDGITPFAADVNNDNAADLVFFTNEHQGGTRAFVALSTTSGLGLPALWWNGSGYTYDHIKLTLS